MKNTVLTPVSAREMRESYGLSQARVARETGISRSYLSLFESGRYLLPDGALQTLLSFYESQQKTSGIESQESVPASPMQRRVDAATFAMADPARPNAPAKSSTSRTIDGFQYVDSLSAGDAELVATKYHANDERLTQLLAEKYEAPFLDDQSDSEEEAMHLLAANALFVRAFRRGYESEPGQTDKGDKSLASVLLRKIAVKSTSRKAAKAPDGDASSQYTVLGQLLKTMKPLAAEK